MDYHLQWKYNLIYLLSSQINQLLPLLIILIYCSLSMGICHPVQNLKMFSHKYQSIISKCIAQNADFVKWDIAKNYYRIHHSHYDWWAFPINEPSSHGDKYQIMDKDVQMFKNHPQFIAALRSNAILVCKAWGYNLVEGKPYKDVAADQKWQGWPIRLYKMTKSLQLFSQQDLHANAVNYGISLIDKGNKFFYKHDLSQYFNKYRVDKNQPHL